MHYCICYKDHTGGFSGTQLTIFKCGRVKQVIILRVKMFIPLVKKDGICNFSVSKDSIAFCILTKEN